MKKTQTDKAKEEVTDPRLQAIGDKIRKLRIQSGYTSYETFAFEKEINRIQYARMENGANITLKSLLKIIDIHDLTLEGFFKGLK